LWRNPKLLQHHPLNTSDHLPVKIEAKWSTEGNDTSLPTQSINWTKVIEEGLIEEYAKEVEDIIRPLIGIPYPSNKALEVEICMVASRITAAVSDCLPHTGLKRPKRRISCTSRMKPSSQSARSKERLETGSLMLENLELALCMNNRRLSRDMFASI